MTENDSRSILSKQPQSAIKKPGGSQRSELSHVILASSQSGSLKCAENGIHYMSWSSENGPDLAPSGTIFDISPTSLCRILSIVSEYREKVSVLRYHLTLQPLRVLAEILRARSDSGWVAWEPAVRLKSISVVSCRNHLPHPTSSCH